jgi:anaerobic ribonucleoside-triphosphate reductase
VDVSRKKLRKQIENDLKESGVKATDEQITEMTESRLSHEIKSGIQLIQYQILTLMTTNGQTPFVSMFIWINEVPDGQTRKDLALLTEEVLRQRIQGIKNEKGVYVTPAFPKILYVLDENNTYEGSEYFYLTKIAAKCSAKRLVPDFISAKIMREYKQGDVYPCMGCFDGNHKVYTIPADTDDMCTDPITLKELFERSIRQSGGYDVETVGLRSAYTVSPNNTKIWDPKEKRYVKLLKVIKNEATSGWLRIQAKKVFEVKSPEDSGTNEKQYTYDCKVHEWLVTNDHPFETLETEGITWAENLNVGDHFYGTASDTDINWNCESEEEGKLYQYEVTDIIPANIIQESYDVTTETEHFWCDGMYAHNCRSFLTPDRFSDIIGNVAHAMNYVEGKHKYYGRFNQGVVTINLVDVACSSKKDMDAFWDILEDRLELCHRALRCRHDRLCGTSTNIAPILFQHGAIARLSKDDTIDPLLYDGYSTISLGYAGLYETCKYMLDVSHTSEEGEKFALAVMQKLNDKCTEWKKAENIDYSVYGTPLESTTYKFAKCLKKRFGEIKDVTDHNYITNSYHCVVREEISAFDKLKFESKFQKLSPGGAISYVEVPNLTDNIESVISIIQYIYENIMYAEINSKSDYCMECGYDGEIKIKEEDSGKLVWECPNCGNRDQNKMSVARRSCGSQPRKSYGPTLNW